MELHGYEVGTEPTESEYDTHKRVEAYYQRVFLAEWLNHERECFPDSFEMPTPGQFEDIFERFARARSDSGEEEERDLGYAYEWVMCE